MQALVVSASIAAALTAIFAFRYSESRHAAHLAAYFLTFFALESAMEIWLLPKEALPLEVAYVCFGITALFVVASRVRDQFDAEAPDR